MTNERFGKRLILAAALALLSVSASAAQQAAPEPKPGKPGKPIAAGDVLSGELGAMRARGGKRGKPKVASYQLKSEPRRLPAPDGLCDLETGPETFQLVTSSDAQAAQLKGLVGKQIEVRVDQVACSKEPGQMSDAVITRWSLVTKR